MRYLGLKNGKYTRQHRIYAYRLVSSGLSV